MLTVIIVALFFIIAAIIFFIGKVEDSGKTYKIRRYSAIPFVLGLIILLATSWTVIDPGQVGIPVTFGSAGAPLQPGGHILNPFTELKGMSVRTEEYTMTSTHAEGSKQGDDSVEVKGADGATGHVDATVLYHLNEADASKVYSELGVGFVDKLVRPTIRTCIRDAYATTPMIQAATEKRGEVELLASTCIEKGINPRGFTVESVQLRKVGLDEQVQKSIDSKVAAQQQAQQKQFELQAATQDAEKKRIESLATADGQQIIKCGGTPTVQADGTTKIIPNTSDKCENKLTPEFLEWFYIDMLKSMVGSPNHDTVIIPSKPDTPVQIQIPQK